MLNSAELLRPTLASARYKSPDYLLQSICNCIASVLLKLYYYLLVIKRRLNLLTLCKVFFYRKLHVVVLIRALLGIRTDKEYQYR